MAHNCLIDFVRKQPSAAPGSLDAAADVAQPDTARAYEQVVDRDLIGAALAQLTAEQRQAVELRFLQGLSVAEVSAIVGRSEDAVKKLQARGLASLRRSLTAVRGPAAPGRSVRAA